MKDSKLLHADTQAGLTQQEQRAKCSPLSLNSASHAFLSYLAPPFVTYFSKVTAGIYTIILFKPF